MTPRPSIQKRLALALVTALVSGLAALAIWWVCKSPEAPAARNGIHFEALEPDPVIGLRPRSSAVLKGVMGPLLGANVPITRHQNNLGLVRTDDLHGELSGPRILVHGDSHIMGIVNTADNVTSLLEKRLRQEPGMSGALVLNAACHDYTLYQYVLRNRSLAKRLKPDLIVVVAYMGNDFLGLEDTRRPHLDDGCQERPKAKNPPAETTTQRLATLGLGGAGPLSGIFWQGLNQALYFQQRPERLAFIKKKAVRALQLLKAEASQSEAGLVLVMLPSFDLVLPQEVKVLENQAVRELLDSGVQQRFYDWFRGVVQEQAIECIDLLPLLSKDGRKVLFANDLHIWIPAHRMIAAELHKRITKTLRDR